ncbi:helix-turn-helix transcriptional regulator [Roseovarius atlanticus]|uniref:helix-turn-helix transcriptional regulator n=1 Tax=Roseovarius atlanticus TaxID=1641875 RepID=UPI001C96273D|nr:helix-turn-helix domain-containing protein [Roseovarius atlanticus]MBY5987102.1 helix-turn-helix domain-containing protein [Roseovarius atlanticus]MBY6125742.1 helix-turn-helix domain-containing protein [Roseovarius atlanticus]MBY6149797.1 helix-turn-helix domain-containing protein [Roseovarius atlanticus]
MNSSKTDRLLSVKETARTLGCSVATVWRGVANGTISRPVKIGGLTRWPESEIMALIESVKADREAA